MARRGLGLQHPAGPAERTPLPVVAPENGLRVLTGGFGEATGGSNLWLKHILLGQLNQTPVETNLLEELPVGWPPSKVLVKTNL